MDQKHGERVESAWSIASSSDLSMFVVDSFRQLCKPDPRVIELLKEFRHTLQNPGKTCLVMTKIDKVPHEDLEISESMGLELARAGSFDAVFQISALRGKAKDFNVVSSVG